jgi:leucyl-tRNA synthetase
VAARVKPRRFLIFGYNKTYMKRYDPKSLEPKWQQTWADTKLYAAKDGDTERPKYVMLTEFPYPSGDGLHMGHVREYTLGDIVARYKRMTGHNVLYPMGYDAFGLPAENFAIKHKITPQAAVERNIATFRQQFDSLGYSFDWDRSFSTTDPEFYRWTQWLFLRFYEAGLAYQAEIAINWCPFCKTGLANEEVINGRHERCGTLVVKKQLKQWMLKITDYADRLIDGLQTVDYPSRIADQQINWVGRSVGAELEFAVDGSDTAIKVFTTRPDTLFGATYMVLAPEHELVEKITAVDHRAAVRSYVASAQAKSEIERMETDRTKTGVFTGAYAINPVNQEKVPVWVADYVLMGYGTGAIMAVPAHDQRDGEFARKFNLPIKPVIEPITGTPQQNPEFRRSIVAIVEDPQTGDVLSINWGSKLGGNLFIGGGLEEGDTNLIETAKREIAEETGYTDVELVSQTGKVHHHYFAASKNKARVIEAVGLHFRLKSHDRGDQALEADEAGKFTVEWLTQEQAARQVQDPLHARVFAELVRGEFYTGEGIMVNSGEYDGMSSAEAREQIMAKYGRERVNYKLRDWIFSRQRYWGEPIPMIHCPEHGAVPVPDDQLPVVLPDVEHYEPTDNGESPLAAITDWVNVDCPLCGGPAKRETDTMPNWAGSNWYYLRYYDAHNDQVFAGRDKLDYWRDVDMYLGGMEHTTLHLLYSRFCHQFLYDKGLVPTPEPYRARRGQGIVLAADGSKMSKSRGNVINPTDYLEKGYGADALRLTLAFLAPYDQTTPWNSNGVDGTKRFLNRVWALVQDHLVAPAPTATNEMLETAVAVTVHRAIKKLTEDIHNWNFNTPVAAMMEAVNELYKLKTELPLGGPVWAENLKLLIQILAPYAPHLAEELWQDLGGTESVHISRWPSFDPELVKADLITVVLQVNGKVRSQVELTADAGEDEISKLAQQDENILRHLEGKELVRMVYVPGKLVNFVVK